MGYKVLQLKLPTYYSDDDIRLLIGKKLGLSDFSYQIAKKGLDARKKKDIHWLISIVVSSDKLSTDEYPEPKLFPIPYKKRDKTVIVIGSGPAGFFTAQVLQLAGFKVTIVERGSEVEQRSLAIQRLEERGEFSPQNNYAFGEGGAGTFSDGKLTSRSKHISSERLYILSEYVKAGAPKEISYMSHPHVGTDILKVVVTNLRQMFLKNGGVFLFNTMLEDVLIKNNRVEKVVCNNAELQADYIILATGHSAYETYRMLIRRGIQIGTKNFAIGHRIEHKQRFINMAQWGKESLPGVKAAEYRLNTTTSSGLPVYTFCMCPGGYVVPASAYPEKSVVNGMSYFMRDGIFSNAACVAGVHPDMLLGHTSTASEILDWMDKLEGQFYNFSNNLVIPAVRAIDYINRSESNEISSGSYRPGVKPAPLYNMIPKIVSSALSEGLTNFSNKLKGFELGVMMGLESKTSSPVQVAREKTGRCPGFDNLYFVGEGSGFAGGIISSASDGVKCAISIINSC